jgi:hypothetical protein
MRHSHKIANWFLELLGLDAALTGDLLEECAGGRSTIWYWRQVLIAVLTSIWGAIRDHKLLALRAIATGFAIELPLIFLWQFVPDLHLPPFSVEFQIINGTVSLLAHGTTGWIVARTHRAHPVPMASAFLVCFLLWYVSRNFSEGRMILVDSLTRPEARPYLALYLMVIFYAIVGVLAGGILGARPKEAGLLRRPMEDWNEALAGHIQLAIRTSASRYIAYRRPDRGMRERSVGDLVLATGTNRHMYWYLGRYPRP